jgi:hypothetical protein
MDVPSKQIHPLPADRRAAPARKRWYRIVSIAGFAEIENPVEGPCIKDFAGRCVNPWWPGSLQLLDPHDRRSESSNEKLKIPRPVLADLFPIIRKSDARVHFYQF